MTGRKEERRKIQVKVKVNISESGVVDEIKVTIKRRILKDEL